MGVDLPEELLCNIWSLVPGAAEDSPSLRGLRIAYTCRDSYRHLQPLVIECYIALLSSAIDSGVIADIDKADLEAVFWEFESQNGRGLVYRPGGSNIHQVGTAGTSLTNLGGLLPTLQRISFHARLDENPDLIWSLSSLLVRVGALQRRLPYFKLQGRPIHRGVARDPFLTLLERGLEHSSTFALSYSSRTPTRTEDPEARRHTTLGLTANLVPRVTELKLDGPLSTTFPLTCMDIDTVFNGTARSLHILSLINLSFSRSQWEDALTAWTLPSLGVLTITEYTDDLPWPSLSAFLRRHQSLTHFSIRSIEMKMCSMAPGPASSQDTANTQLTGTQRLYQISESNLQTLLQILDPSTFSMSSMGAVDVSFYPFKLDVSGLSNLASFLALLGLHAPNLHTLRISLPSKIGVQAWLRNFSKPSANSPFVRASKWASGFFGESQNSGSYSTSMKSLRKAMGTLTQLRTFHLSLETQPLRAGTEFVPPSHIIEFLSAFPSLREAHISNAFRYDLRSSGEKNLSAATFWKELIEVWSRCKTLERLVIQGAGKVSRSTQWDRDDENPMGGYRFEDAFPPPFVAN